MNGVRFQSGTRHAVVLAAFSKGLLLFGQAAGSGSLAGTVYDQAGARLNHATVTVKNAGTGAESSTHPNDKGDYRLEDLGAGNYVVRVAATGLSTVQVNDVTIQEKKTTTVNLTLSLAESTPVSVVQVSAPPEPSDAARSVVAKPVIPQNAPAPLPAMDPADELKGIMREIAGVRDRLALSADQQSKMRVIFQERQAQVAAIRQDGELMPGAKRERIKAARQDAEAKFRGLLNENQLEEYDQILRERRLRALEKQRQAVVQ